MRSLFIVTALAAVNAAPLLDSAYSNDLAAQHQNAKDGKADDNAYWYGPGYHSTTVYHSPAWYSSHHSAYWNGKDGKPADDDNYLWYGPRYHGAA